MFIPTTANTLTDMHKRLLFSALALLLTAGSLHAQNTTVTRRGRDGRLTTTVVRGTGTGFTYSAGTGANASAIPSGTRDFTYTPDPLTGIPVQRPNIAGSLARDGRVTVDGSVARAVRSGQPLQMVNPFAPANFGDGSDMVRREPEDPEQRPRGFKLFAFQF